MGISIWHILVVAVVVIVLFGRGKISGVMEEVGKGIRGFKRGLNDDSDANTTPTKTIERQKDE